MSFWHPFLFFLFPTLSPFHKVRRSDRLLGKKEKHLESTHIIESLRLGVDIGVGEIDSGPVLQRGVGTTQNFRKGDFVVEYAGDYIATTADYHRRMIEHDEAGRNGSYVFWFKHEGSQRWCVSNK